MNKRDFIILFSVIINFDKVANIQEDKNKTEIFLYSQKKGRKIINILFKNVDNSFLVNVFRRIKKHLI